VPWLVRDDAAIWYEDLGEGAPVLLVHGGLFDPMDGRRFWMRPGVADAVVAAGHRVLIPDRRFGTGKTRAPFAVHSWDVEAGDLRAVLDHGAVAAAHVVAGSNGCSAAIRLALTRPDRVRSLLLCWPATPDGALPAAFARAVEAIAWGGPRAYLGGLRAHGLPRPNADRPGFPWGAALLSDDRLATAFQALPAVDAARTVERSAAALFAGNVLRGMTDRDALALGRLGIPIGVVPAEPEDRPHQAATAERLAGVIARSLLLPGFPPTPSPAFARAGEAFAALLREWFGAKDDG
jgi:pimeloyl-ACP methyl ester carboxylesterase